MLPNSYREDDPPGVRLDTLTDARMEVEHTIHQLKEAYLIFDDIADDNEGIWTDDERTEVRGMQSTVSALIASKETDLEDIEQLYENLGV